MTKYVSRSYFPRNIFIKVTRIKERVLRFIGEVTLRLIFIVNRNISTFSMYSPTKYDTFLVIQLLQAEYRISYFSNLFSRCSCVSLPCNWILRKCRIFVQTLIRYLELWYNILWYYCRRTHNMFETQVPKIMQRMQIGISYCKPKITWNCSTLLGI